MNRGVQVFVIAVTVVAVNAPAQSNIDPAHKFGWSENCGWMNWRDAGAGQHGVRILPTCLTGWIWSENLGWITVGHGPIRQPVKLNFA